VVQSLSYNVLSLVDSSPISISVTWHDAGFHSVVHTVEQVIAFRQRGHSPSLRWVDAGPSGTAAVEEVKQKLGFTITDQWQDQGWCDYSGDYEDLYGTPTEFATRTQRKTD
jgi:hypothetical protein